MTVLTFVAGWLVGAASIALVIGAVIDLADRYAMPTTQPAGIKDPETQLLWAEDGLITGRTWTA